MRHFRDLDADSSGEINAQELAALFDKAGTAPEQLQLLITEVDKDQNKGLSFEEFVNLLNNQQAYLKGSGGLGGLGSSWT